MQNCDELAESSMRTLIQQTDYIYILEEYWHDDAINILAVQQLHLILMKWSKCDCDLIQCQNHIMDCDKTWQETIRQTETKSCVPECMQLHTKMQFKEVGMCTCMAMGKMQTADLQIVQWLTCR